MVAIAVQGFLCWLFLSGMETGLYLLLLGLALLQLAAWTEPAPPHTLIAVAALAPLARPDGLAIVLVTVCLIALRSRRRAPARVLLEVALLLAPFVFYLLLCWRLTGSATTAGLAMKAVTHHPYYDAAEAFRWLRHNLASDTRTLLLGGEQGKSPRTDVRPEKAGAFSGRQSRQGKNQRPCSKMAGRREINDLKPIDKAIFGMVSESPGRNESERTVAPKVRNPGGRAPIRRAKAARTATSWLMWWSAPAGW